MGVTYVASKRLCGLLVLESLGAGNARAPAPDANTGGDILDMPRASVGEQAGGKLNVREEAVTLPETPSKLSTDILLAVSSEPPGPYVMA